MNVRALMIPVLFVSIAAGANPPQEPPPPKKIFQLQRLMGQYQCKGTVFAFGPVHEHKVQSTLTGKAMYDDNVLELTRVEHKTPENPHPMESRGYFVWDEAEKKFDFIGVVSDGGFWTETGLPYVFTGPNHFPGEPEIKGRDTWKPGSIFAIDYLFEVEEKGVWKKAIEESCTRK